MPSEQYEVQAEPEVTEDVLELKAIDAELVPTALKLMFALRDDPWMGESLFERYNLRPIKDCRKIRFDLPNWKGKPRFRIVYRNEPTDGAPALVRVWSVGPRGDLVAYARATSRISRSQASTRRRQR